MLRTFTLTLAALAAVGLGGAFSASHAGGYTGGGHSGGGYCPHPTHPGSSINIHKTIRINNSVHISKRIVINKPVTINKSIVINKGGSSSALAIAKAEADASARSESASVAIASGGSSVVDVEAPPASGGGFGEIAVETPCVEQWAIVVKAIHAECVDRSGNHHPASRMRPETWVDSSMNAEIFRCLEGSHLYVQIGDVTESDHGMAGVYQGAQVIQCAPGEALRHYRDGAVKCARQEHVPDCTERTNMRQYGLGDIFFSYREKVCARVSASAGAVGGAAASYSEASGTTQTAQTSQTGTSQTSGGEVEVSGTFNGGVGN